MYDHTSWVTSVSETWSALNVCIMHLVCLAWCHFPLWYVTYLPTWTRHPRKGYMVCSDLPKNTPGRALVSASGVHEVQKNSRYHVWSPPPLEWTRQSEAEGDTMRRAICPLLWRLFGRRSSSGASPHTFSYRPQNSWSSRSTRWPWTTGASAPWLSSASRASDLFSLTGSPCSGEWGTGACGWGQERPLKGGGCPSVFVMSFTSSYLPGCSQPEPETSVICLP